MRAITKIAILGIGIVSMLLIDIPLLQSVDEAEAIAGVRRRTARRTAVVVGSSASAATASANQQAAAAQQDAAQANADAAAAQADAEMYKQQAEAAQAAAAAPVPGALPIGTVVTTLPAGCTTITAGGVEYQSCGPNYYRAAFQGSQLVYVTAKP